MLRIYYLFILLNMSIFVYAQMLTNQPNNYGPYNLSFQNYSDCKGPKARNVTLMTTTLNEDYVGVANFTFFSDTKLEEIKIRVHNIKDNKKNFLWNYKLTDPCKHFSIALMIQQNLKAEHCFIKKGFYSSQFNLRDVIVSFMGSSFFYGNYTFKADLLSKQGNIGCFTGTVIISKQP